MQQQQRADGCLCTLHSSGCTAPGCLYFHLTSTAPSLVLPSYLYCPSHLQSPYMYCPLTCTATTCMGPSHVPPPLTCNNRSAPFWKSRRPMKHCSEAWGPGQAMNFQNKWEKPMDPVLLGAGFQKLGAAMPSLHPSPIQVCTCQDPSVCRGAALWSCWLTVWETVKSKCRAWVQVHQQRPSAHIPSQARRTWRWQGGLLTPATTITEVQSVLYYSVLNLHVYSTSTMQCSAVRYGMRNALTGSTHGGHPPAGGHPGRQAAPALPAALPCWPPCPP